ncbi:MAG: type II toxin-antitoxin system death-on-curing family toxin [Candidatus Acidiferrales bacterium]
MKEPQWIDERDALAPRGRLLALGGNAGGLRDAALLKSALARPRQLHAYVDNAHILDLAAAYISAIIRNHPFLDGSKRTGFLVGILFLEINGYRFVASEEDATQAIMRLAARIRKVVAREHEMICWRP